MAEFCDCPLFENQAIPTACLPPPCPEEVLPTRCPRKLETFTIFGQNVSHGDSGYEVIQANEDSSNIIAGISAYQRARGCISQAQYELEFQEALAWFLERFVTGDITPAEVSVEPHLQPNMFINLPYSSLTVTSHGGTRVLAFYRPEVFCRDLKLLDAVECSPEGCEPYRRRRGGCAVIVQHRFLMPNEEREGLVRRRPRFSQPDVTLSQPQGPLFRHPSSSCPAPLVIPDYPFLISPKDACLGGQCTVVPPAPVNPLLDFHNYSSSVFVGYVQEDLGKGGEPRVTKFRSLYPSPLLLKYSSTAALPAVWQGILVEYAFAEAVQERTACEERAQEDEVRFAPLQPVFPEGFATFIRSQDLRCNLVDLPLSATIAVPRVIADNAGVSSIFTQGVSIAV